MLSQIAAAAGTAEAYAFVAKFNEIILYPTIALLSAVAFLVFLWGTAQYFMNAASDTARQEGVKHITYGIIGLVVMLSAFTILKIAAATFGLDQQASCAQNPNQNGCEDAFKLPDINSNNPGSGSPGSNNPGSGSPGFNNP